MKSFKSKIIFPTIIIVVILTVILTAYTSIVFLWFSDFLIQAKVNTNINSLKLYLDTAGHRSKTAAVSMAHNFEAIKAIESRDRNEILRVFANVCDLYRITFLTVMDDQGNVLVRVHEPNRFGDSLAQQRNVRDAMNGNTSTYFEEGTAVKVSVRTGTPVYNADGTLIGLVSAGVRFDTNEAVDELKQLLHAEVAVFLGDTRYVTTIRMGEQPIIETKLDTEIAKIVIDDKREYFGNTKIFDAIYKAFCMPLLNADNEPFAAIFIGSPMTEQRAMTYALIRNFVVISSIVLIVAICLLYWIVSSISEPLIKLSKDMDNIEEGHLSVTIDAHSSDEVGRAGKSLQRVTHTLHKLIDDINDTIAEHARGNTDYLLDVHAFHGDYRLLAQQIVALSHLGMKDKLTGIPNRHAFDNRLDLEWSRALRDKTPLSLLMIDVDKFKIHNDTYGHQQGDQALQTVAKVLLQPLRRAVDFAARWGGEEFVVLLPNTDAKGALHFAELIRTKVENAAIPSIDGGTPHKVTISIGVNTQTPLQDTSIEELISKADEALYRAKATGRNRVCLSEAEQKYDAEAHTNP